ncbi:MAG: hypothetical protein Q9M33_11095 [Robiginitomaculum sp.]|nr:hypothetical protein [Robiginitomaculum sp.]
MGCAAQKTVRRGTVHLIFSAHEAEWDAILTHGRGGELMHIEISPASDESGVYPARLRGHYASALALCDMVNGLLRRHTARAISDTLRAVFTVANGHGAAVVRPAYQEFLAQILRLLERGA